MRTRSQIIFVTILLATAAAAQAETLVATRVLRPQTVITEDDVKIENTVTSGALTNARDAIGLEVRSAIYAGQPIRLGDLASPAVIERNQAVTLAYSRGGLTIHTEGRSLSRGTTGDTIKVMNTSSKTTLLATIGPDGLAYVQPQ